HPHSFRIRVYQGLTHPQTQFSYTPKPGHNHPPPTPPHHPRIRKPSSHQPHSSTASVCRRCGRVFSPGCGGWVGGCGWCLCWSGWVVRNGYADGLTDRCRVRGVLVVGPHQRSTRTGNRPVQVLWWVPWLVVNCIVFSLVWGVVCLVAACVVVTPGHIPTMSRAVRGMSIYHGGSPWLPTS